MRKSNYLVCEYCSYATQKKSLMDIHLRTDKHKRNTEKNYIVLDGGKEAIRRAEEKVYRTKLACPTEIREVLDEIALSCSTENLIEYTKRRINTLEVLSNTLHDDNEKSQCKAACDKHRNELDLIIKTNNK